MFVVWTYNAYLSDSLEYVLHKRRNQEAIRDPFGFEG